MVITLISTNHVQEDHPFTTGKLSTKMAKHDVNGKHPLVTKDMVVGWKIMEVSRLLSNMEIRNGNNFLSIFYQFSFPPFI
jgi:hypothetical protein